MTEHLIRRRRLLRSYCFDTMKAFQLAVTLTSVIVVAVASGDFLSSYDLKREVDTAQRRFDNDFLLGVWYRANEAIVEARDKLLKLYTHYTMQQAEQVLEHIAKYTNFTTVESEAKRNEVLTTKNTTLIMELTDCIFRYEGSTIQAYKITGYNLHVCIGTAQVETEKQYLAMMSNFERIKNASLELHSYHSKKTENCLDKMCVLSSLIQSVVHYEKLQEEIATNVTEINGLNTRYLLTHIALGCVSEAMRQVEENYNIGKGLVEGCFSRGNQTEENEILKEQPEVSTNQ